MTETERKALAILEEITDYTCREIADANFDDICAALRRAIERHEAFKQEVSDAVENWWYKETPPLPFRRFIIAKPDPLEQALLDAARDLSTDDFAKALRAAIEKRGGKIVWGEGA